MIYIYHTRVQYPGMIPSYPGTKHGLVYSSTIARY
jgi:hypothetical protein